MSSPGLTRLSAHMDDEQCEVLRSAMSVVVLLAGKPLFTEGEPLDALHAVDSGAVELSIEVHDEPVVLGHVAAGNFFGALNMLEGGTAAVTATATATESARVLRLTRASLDTLRRDHTAVASLLLRALVEDLAVRVRDANTLEVDDGTDGPHEPEKKGWFAKALGKLLGGAH